MSRKILRKDKTCLNCFHVVEKLHCPNCGQENIETRKTFHELFVHFFEDLTHYENSFWKTIRNLMLKSSALTKEYLSGKRMSYLAPIRLYIFISFITFFFIAILPSDESIIEITDESGKVYESDLPADQDDFNFGYTSVRQLDSIQKFGSANEKLGDFEYKVARQLQLLSDKYTINEFMRLYTEALIQNMPKILFIYMPLFAFVLYLFESKKRWYYFDHGIFTLHYFSFLLLMLLLFHIIKSMFLQFQEVGVAKVIQFCINAAIIIYSLYYFFPAHHRFYGSTRFVTLIKGLAMLIINTFVMTVLFAGMSIYILLKFH